jgi:hypothetical protein
LVVHLADRDHSERDVLDARTLDPRDERRPRASA